MAIEVVKIRATITVGSLSVSTPYIQSFNVRKSRNNSSTCDAVLKIVISGSSSATGDIVIKAGEGSASNTIFTGTVKKAHITPCWDDPEYCFLNLSGSDLFYILENKTYTRRCRASVTSWATIDSVVRAGLRSTKFSNQIESIIMTPDLSTKNDTAAENASYKVLGVPSKVVSSPATSGIMLTAQIKQ